MNSKAAVLDADFKALIERLSTKYGAASNACLMARIEYLIAQLTDRGRVTSDWEMLRRQIESHYTVPTPSRSRVHMHSNTSVGTDGEKIYEFSQEAYTELYGGRVSTPGTVIREVERGDLRDLRSGDWYLYIVAEMDQLVIHNEPMSLTELIASRTVTEDGPLPVIHPTLAERYGFRVKAAGEFSPVIAEGGAVVGVVVNSKSGHFCPAPQTLNVACRAFARVAPDARIVPVAVRLRLTD